MRLRHKTGSEDEVKNSEFCLHEKYKATGKIYLELGMGKGQFIINNAILNKDINYVGVEKYATVVLKAIEKLKANQDIKNLIFLCDDVENLLNYFDIHSIDKIYLNFSDPWPKKRHANRRITHKKFLDLYEKLLIKNGIIEFKTDNIDLFNFSLEQIELSNFTLLEKTYDLHNDEKLNQGNIMTEYEEKFSKKGNPICKLIAKIL